MKKKFIDNEGYLSEQGNSAEDFQKAMRDIARENIFNDPVYGSYDNARQPYNTWESYKPVADKSPVRHTPRTNDSLTNQTSSSNSDIYHNTDVDYKNADNSISGIDYRYDEYKFLNDCLSHIDSTYGKHYAGNIQTTEYIMANAKSLDFLVGNVVKYASRYGKKNGANKEDLYKAVHFIAMMAKYTNIVKSSEEK